MYGPYAPKLNGFDDSEHITNADLTHLFGWSLQTLKRFYLDGSHGFPEPATQGRRRLHNVGALRKWAERYDKEQGWS